MFFYCTHSITAQEDVPHLSANVDSWIQPAVIARPRPLFLANRNNIRTCPAQKFRSASCHHPPRLSVCPCWPGVIDSDLNQSAEVASRFLEHWLWACSALHIRSTVITSQLIAHPMEINVACTCGPCLSVSLLVHVKKINYPSCRNQTIYMHQCRTEAIHERRTRGWLCNNYNWPRSRAEFRNRYKSASLVTCTRSFPSLPFPTNSRFLHPNWQSDMLNRE